jgi:RNA polymerase sigma-70 factor (ECF subfamily)
LIKKNKILSINNEQQLKETFVNIYNGNFERLIRYAFSITKEKELAEDVVAQVFANLWDKRDRLHKIREVGFYLNTSVRNQAIKVVKEKAKLSASKKSNEFNDHESIADSIDPESLLMGKELAKLVSKAVANLPPQARLVYNLSKNDKSNGQIAEELGISKRTVENHLYKVLNKLREALENYFKAES